MLSATAAAQTIVPVDARFPSPDGFIFEGSWKCEDKSGGEGRGWQARPSRRGGILERLRQRGRGSRRRPNIWSGHYVVAYDRDKRQFIMIDADDPAYVAYWTDGWRDREITLTSEETQLMPNHRLVYKVDDRHQFSVTYAVWDHDTWATQPHNPAERVASSAVGEDQGPKRS
jgi:hypothetical protein